MTLLLKMPALLSFLVLAAHFFRGDGVIFCWIAFALFLMVLLSRRPWILRTAQAVLLLGCLEWIMTAYNIAQDRIADDRPWQRMAAILLTVAAVNLIAAALLQIVLRRTPAPAPTLTDSPAPTPQTPA